MAMTLVLAMANGGGIAGNFHSQRRGSALSERRRTRWRLGAVKPSPKGFGAPNPSRKKKQPFLIQEEEEESEVESGEDEGEDIVPEVVTNRMLQRMGFTVGVPMVVGVLFFGLYYYLKAVRKLEIPEWLPVATSFLTFGASAAGISYAVVSSSWDPQREGSLLGWREARANWPLLWQGKASRRSKD